MPAWNKIPSKHKQDSDKGESESASRSAILEELGPYMGLGWILAVSVLGGTLGGVYLDGRLGWTPWLTLTGIALGMAAGFVSLFRTLKVQEQRRQGSKEAKGKPQDGKR